MDKVSKKDCDRLIKNDWKEVKVALHTGQVNYSEIDKLLEYRFFKQYNDMFSLMEFDNTVELSSIQKLARGVRGWYYDNGDKFDYERFIPKIKYSGLNRFNPPEKIFIYLGINSNNKELSEEKVCIKELRANRGDKVSLCEFVVNNSALNKRVVDLTIGNDSTYEELINNINRIIDYANISNDLNKKLGNFKKNDKEFVNQSIRAKKGPEYKIAKELMKIYTKMITDDLFKAVDGLDRQYEYAPFHAFANYFQQKGYTGIIYNSTVSPENRNLVLFDISDVNPIGKIKNIEV